MAVVTAGFGANTGLDASGMVFGLGYQSAAESLLKLATAAVNACRYNGVAIQVGASNYSRAEAASRLGGGGGVLSAPGKPARIEAPGPPGTLGPGEPPPLLWALVQSFVDDVWPDGDVAALHAAAGCWRAFGSAATGMQGALSASQALVGTQQIPEGDLVTRVLSKMSSDIGRLDAQCAEMARVLDDFANELSHAQNAIRDLLHRLELLTDLWHDVVSIFDGEALDEIKRIGKDINAVLHNLGREARSLEQGAQLLMQRADDSIVDFEKYMRGEFTQFLGDEIGNPVATVFDTLVNGNEGVVKAAFGALQSVVDLDPRWFLIDPEGAAAPWGSMAKTGLANALINPQEAGEANLQSFKSLLHLNDWRSDRPGLGLGGDIFEAVMLFGGGEAGAVADGARGAARVAEAGGDSAGAMGRAGELGDIARASGALRDIGKASDGLTKDLESLKLELPKADPLPGGRPVGGQPGRTIEAPAEPAPHPVEAAPPGTRVPESPTVSHESVAPSRSATTLAPHEPSPAPTAAAHEPVPVYAPSSASLTDPLVDDARASQAASTPAAPIGPAPHFTAPTGGRPPELSAPGNGWHWPAEGGPTGGGPRGATPDGGPPGGGGYGGSKDSSGPPGSPNDGTPDAPGDGGGRQDPVHSHEPSGDGWHRLPDQPTDPHFGEPLSAHWDFAGKPADPNTILPSIAKLIRDPGAPFGRDPLGHAYSEQQYAERFNNLSPYGDEWMNFPGNDGAVPGTKVAFTNADQFAKFYGRLLDRVGSDSGKYLAVMEDGMPASWEERSLHVNSLADSYHSFVLENLPEGWKIEVSKVAPGMGQPGGSIQVRILDSAGRAMTVEELIEIGGVLK
ncbi:TNT domain-containing protein [Mycobacterium montefiorense]|nr:TNT domain-containing protein [Mycobacterium montefiorense]